MVRQQHKVRGNSVLVWVVPVMVGIFLSMIVTTGVQAKLLATECGSIQVVCWQPASVDQIRTRLQPEGGFQVINHTSDSVNVAYGWFERGADYRRIGEITLPIPQPALWAAEGWFNLKPNTTQVYYSRSTDQEVYVRLEVNGSDIEPTNHSGTTEFCVATQSFISNEQAGTDWFEINYINRGTMAGESCAVAGGELRTFYRVAGSSTLILE